MSDICLRFPDKTIDLNLNKHLQCFMQRILSKRPNVTHLTVQTSGPENFSASFLAANEVLQKTTCATASIRLARAVEDMNELVKVVVEQDWVHMGAQTKKIGCVLDANTPPSHKTKD